MQNGTTSIADVFSNAKFHLIEKLNALYFKWAQLIGLISVKNKFPFYLNDYKPNKHKDGIINKTN